MPATSTPAPEPSEAEVLAALQALKAQADEETGGAPEAVTEPEALDNAETATAPATTEVTDEPAKGESVIGQQDDIESLKARLKTQEESFEALRNKTSSSLEWSRNLTLKKATEADQLRGVLRKIKEKGEVSAEEIDRYLAPAQSAPSLSGQAPQQDDGLAQMEAFRFTVDNNLSDETAGKFDSWIRAQNSAGTINPRDIVEGNPYATLSILYSRYEREQPKEQAASTAELVRAAQNVARTQRAAARAAGPPASRSTASSPPDTQVDLSELIKKDPEAAYKSGLIDKLFKQVHADAGL